MGIGKLSTRSSKQVIKPEFFNTIKDALIGMIVPRNISGDATDKAGSLGSNDYRFDELHVDKINSPGANFIGMIVPYYTFNNLTTVGEGWMKCDGRQINQANYDAEHGAGSWSKYIGTSVLDGRYLPNMSKKFLIGNSYPDSQTGFSPFLYSGNADNKADINHKHGWLGYQLNNVPATANSAGLNSPLESWSITNTNGQNAVYIKADNIAAGAATGSVLKSQNPYYTFLLSNAEAMKDITPHSFECYYAMRIK